MRDYLKFSYILLFRIGWAAHNFQVQKKEEGVVNSLYIRFSTPQVSGTLYEIVVSFELNSYIIIIQVEILVTEETLHSVFDQYNNVIDASIKKTVCEKVSI